MFERFCFLLVFLLLCGLVSGIQLGVSPSRVDLNLSFGEEKCFNIEIYSDRKVELELDDFWSEEYSHNLNDYRLKMFNVNYDKNFSVDGKSKREICINGMNKGTNYGVLIISSKEKRIGVGVWLGVNSSEEDNIIYSKNYEEEKPINYGLYEVFIMELLLILTLFMLVKKVYI